MSAEWPTLERLFGMAVALPREARARYLEDACKGDPALRRKVEGLLAAHDRLEEGDPGFLETLDPERAAGLLEGASGIRSRVTVAAGEVIGRYRIVRVLGRGGMGVVYLAHDPELDRPVALKVLPPLGAARSSGEPGKFDVLEGRGSSDPSAASDPSDTPDPSGAPDRLLDEARAASALDHPNIGTVYEAGRTETGERFIAMACYDEGTLRERLAAGPLTPERALALARQIASGLAAAHARGIVHRDLKPENLVFDRRGAIKLVDFGLALGRARRVHDAEHSEATEGAQGGGRSPAPRGGTAAYMSPEQARGETGDARADVWAFGVIVHEMLTGRRPGPGERDRLDLPTDTAPELGALLARCRERDPGRRPTSGEALVQALDPALDSTPAPSAAAPPAAAPPAAAPRAAPPAAAPAAPPIRRRRRVNLLAIAAVGLVVVVLGLGFLLVRGLPRVLDAEGSAAGTFPELGWVLVADFDATGEASELAMAAREALAVDLQQSDFVRVMSRAQIAVVLERMGHGADIPLDLPLAMEVAERFGAGVVLGTTIFRAGPDFVLSGRALDPRTGVELFAVRTAASERRLLGAVERLSREMRSRLGETPAALARSLPLPDVTTRSIEALRLYAEAEREFQVDYGRAAALLAAAVEADSTFAMAHRLAAAAATSRLRFGETKAHLELAYRYRERLPERERWHVEAIHHLNGSFEPRRAADAYELLISRYPADVRAWNNLGVIRQGWLGDDEGADDALERALELDPDNVGTLANATQAAYIAGRAERADRHAETADSMGLVNAMLRWQVSRSFAEGDAVAVVSGCERLLTAASAPVSTADDTEICGSMHVAGGRLGDGIRILTDARDAYLRDGRYRNATHAAQALAIAHVLRQDSDGVARQFEWVLEQVPAEGFEEPDRLIARTNLVVQAHLLGQDVIAGRISANYPPFPDTTHWFGRTGTALVAAAGAVRAGDGAGALAMLDQPDLTRYRPIGWRIWDELIRGLAHEQTGNLEAAALHLAAAADPGFLTLPFATKDRVHLPLALDALARVEEARGHVAAADGARARLEALWALSEEAVEVAHALPKGDR